MQRAYRGRTWVIVYHAIFKISNHIICEGIILRARNSNPERMTERGNPERLKERKTTPFKTSSELFRYPVRFSFLFHITYEMLNASVSPVFECSLCAFCNKKIKKNDPEFIYIYMKK